jgi:hypothetical protein
MMFVRKTRECKVDEIDTRQKKPQRPQFWDPKSSRCTYYLGLTVHTSVFQPWFAEPTSSADSLQGSARILKLVLFLVSRFRQKLYNVSKVPRLEKG